MLVAALVVALIVVMLVLVGFFLLGFVGYFGWWIACGAVCLVVGCVWLFGCSVLGLFVWVLTCCGYLMLLFVNSVVVDQSLFVLKSVV